MQNHLLNSGSKKLVYGIGGKDLSQRWVELVRDGHVTSAIVLTEEEDDCSEATGVGVRYGVRLNHDNHLLEFVEIISEDDGQVVNSKLRDRVLAMNKTLIEMQQHNQDGTAIRCIYDGPYAAQLQLVRTLRPPPSKNMISNYSEKVSCMPPEYEASRDSFLVGQLRLFGQAGDFHGDGKPRERAARVLIQRDESRCVSWDIYHNVSPIDRRGHFLLLPALDDEREWRGQSLISNDCNDITYLASTIEPPGSMMLFFNSVGAGASQNHIHCHLLVAPPSPLLGRDYAVAKASTISILQLTEGVTASLLDYPCTCIKLSAAATRCENKKEVMGDALYKILQLAQTRQIPHNVACTNSPSGLTVYVFLRKYETSNSAIGLGGSEMLGVFYCSSEEQLQSLSKNMKDVLSDVSLPASTIWKDVCEALEALMA